MDSCIARAGAMANSPSSDTGITAIKSNVPRNPTHSLAKPPCLATAVCMPCSAELLMMVLGIDSH